ncbi:MAG: hypothetical protein AAF434_12085 [Pseudomonadota bacterium]
MNAKRDDFLANCAQHARVHIVGPMLRKHPEWPSIPTIFVDGGARWQSQLPDDFHASVISVGDGDSIGDRSLDIVLNPEKDVSDLGYALGMLEGVAIEHLSLSGFLGGRRDHEWINLGEVARFMDARRDTRADFEDAIAILSRGQFSLNHHGIFSLVSLKPTRITITGAVKYPLEKTTLLAAHSSHGLSNEATGIFQVTCDRPLLCFFNA